MKDKKYVLIAGCRYFNDYKIAKKYIDYYISNIREKYKITIISGGALGADSLVWQDSNLSRLRNKILHNTLPQNLKYGSIPAFSRLRLITKFFVSVG